MAITNDWLVANVNNPNLDVYDLTTLGDMNTDNTQFMRKEDYLNSKFIKENDLFKDESGNFSQTKFDSFYNAQAQRWHQIQEDSYPKGLQLDYFSTRRKPNSRVRETKFDIGPEYDPANGKMGNPNQVKMGIAGWSTISERTKSEAEIAQSQKVFDPKTNKFLDYSPEDCALFESPVKFFKNIANPFSDPLVLATYEQDEVDQYGIQHHKGEKKLNAQGSYYYEKLGDRSPLNKEILSVGDILTKENSPLNNIDFFDSDDLEKSAAGVIAKNIAFVAPMFTPAAPYYYTAMIAKEMARALPMLYEVGTNLFGGENDAPAWINQLAGKAESYTSGNSVHSGEKVFSFENLANLISDVALQWGQQKRIAQVVQKLGGDTKVLADAEKRAKALYDSKAGGKLASLAKVDESLIAAGVKESELWKNTTLGRLCIEKAYEPVLEAMRAKSQFGADLALIYMAIVSNTDVYSDMKAKGATNKEAAWVTLASTAGMFSVDKYLHLGETFFEGLSDESLITARRLAKQEIKEAGEEIYNYAGKTPAALWTKGGNLGKRIGEKIGNYWEKLKLHDYGSPIWREGFSKAMTEGLEEVSEELVTDMSKGMYSILGDLGLYDKSVQNPIDWDTAMERYGMSFLGGAMGGGLFYGVELYQNNGFNPKQDADLVTFVRKGKANILRKEVNNIRDNGKAGSTTLSGLDYVKDDKGQVTWLSTDQISRSQNNLIADRVIDKINAIEATIVGNNANLNDDQLFEHMVLSDMRYQQYKNAGKITGYYQEFDRRLKNLIKAEDNLRRANLTIDGTPDGEPIKSDSQERKNPNEELKQQRIAELQAKVDEAKKALDDFLSGDVSLEYTRKLNFILDPVLHSPFLDLDYNKFMQEQLGFDITAVANPEDIDPEKLIKAQQEWYKHYKEVMESPAVEKAFAAYLALEKSILPSLFEQEEISKQYEQALNDLTKLFETDPESSLAFGDFMKTHQGYTFNTKLVDENGIEESDEEFNVRFDQSTPENRLKYVQRIQRIADLNRQVYQEYVNKLDEILQRTNYQVDSISARALAQNIQIRIKDIIREESKYARIINGTIFDISAYDTVVQDLKDDLSNIEEVKEALAEKFKAQLKQKVVDIKSNIDRRLNLLPKVLNRDLQASSLSEEEGAIIMTMSEDPVINAVLDITGPLDLKTLIQILDIYRQGLLNLGENIEEGLAQLKDQLNAIRPELGTKLLEDFDASSLDGYIYNAMDAYFNAFPVSAKSALTSISPQEVFTNLLNNISFDYEDGIVVTIQDLINQLKNQKGYYWDLYKINPMLPNQILQILSHPYGSEDEEQFEFGNDIYAVVLEGNVDEWVYNDLVKKGTTISKQLDTVQEYLNITVNRIKTNPIFQFYGKLQNTIHSPLEQIFKQVAVQLSDSKEQQVNVEAILDNVYKSFMNADTISAFTLEEAQGKDLDLVNKVIDMAGAFIYAANTQADGKNFFGQHSQINAWAKEHTTDLTKQWQELPEINDRYSALLNQERGKLKSEVAMWEAISKSNLMNKNKRLIQTDEVLTKLRYKALKGISLKFTVDGKEYNLLEGVEFLPDLFDDQTNNLSALFDVEQKLYENFQNILKESKLSVEEVLSRGNLFESFVKNTLELKQQKVSLLCPEMRALTDYDKAVYILSVLTDNPSNFYQQMIKDVADTNSTIAPIPTQYNLSRLGEAVNSAQYKQAFKYMATKYNVPQFIAAHTMHIDGVAGAGKTAVVLANVKRRYNVKEDNMIVLGPTDTQSYKLGEVLGTAKIFNFEDGSENNIFTKLLGDKYKEIQQEVQVLTEKMSQREVNGIVKEKGKYFDMVGYKVDGQEGISIEIHPEAFEFNTDFKQHFIFVDEAAHLNTVQIAILDLLAERNKGTLYLVSDSNQLGYNNRNTLENLGPVAIYATRTSKMKESLRSSNIQMQENAKKLDQVIDAVNDVFNYGNKAQQTEFMSRLPKLISNLEFRVYNNDNDINGYLLNGDPNDFIPKLLKIQQQNPKATIGFIGSSSSPLYQLMVNSGLKVEDPLSAEINPRQKFMQGQEFDYVIVDSIKGLPENINDPTNSLSQLVDDVLLKFNTLATRGKNASIFVDSFKNIFKPNIIDSKQSMGYNIQESVDMFKREFDKNIQGVKAKLRPTEDVVEELKSPIVTTGEQTLENPHGSAPVEYEPDTPPEVIKKKIEENQPIPDDDVADIGDEQPEMDGIGDFMIEANLVMPVTGLTRKDVNDKSSPWLLPKNKPAILRNLQAFIDENSYPEGLKTFEEKQKFQSYLSAIQSYVLFQDTIENLQRCLPQNVDFDWQSAQLGLELRKIDDTERTDYYGISTQKLKGKPLDDTFLEGKWVFSVVLQVNKLYRPDPRSSEQVIPVRFDIAIMTDPHLLNTSERQEEIIKNAKAEIQQLNNKLNTITDEKTIQAIKLQIQRTERFIQSLPSAAKKYIALYEQLKAKVTNNSLFIPLQNDEYNLHKTTRLDSRHSDRRLGSIIPIENVEGNIRYKDGPHAGEYVTNMDSFMDQDKRKIVSDVYILGKQSDQLRGIIDESILGKAVVFVSNNVLIPRDKLAERYIEQKLDPVNHTPEVRMVVLDNHGLSFSEVVFNRIQKTIRERTQEKTKKPWRMSVLGMRMFASMWNFRAGLNRFLEQYENWKTKYNYSDEFVERILAEEARLFKKFDPDLRDKVDSGEEVKNFTKTLSDNIKTGIALGITDAGVTSEDLKNLIEFNNIYCKDVPIFRLGIYVGKAFTKYDQFGSPGSYIRQFNTSSDSYYQGKDVNLIAISAFKANQFKFYLDEIFRQTLEGDEMTDMYGWKHLGLSFSHPDGTPVDANEIIGQDEISKNLSGLIHTEEHKITVQGYEVSNNELFSFFPQMVARITEAAHQKCVAPGSGDGYIRFDILEGAKETKKEIKSGFNLNRLLMLDNKTYGLRPGSENVMLYMFDLIFHGSLVNLEKWKKIKKGEKLHRAYSYDAPFKYGFFIDPTLEYADSQDQILELNIGPQGQQSKFTLLKVGTHPAYFDVNVNVIPGGMAINFDTLLARLNNTPQRKEELEPIKPSIVQGQTEEQPSEFDQIFVGISDDRQDLKEFYENPIKDDVISNRMSEVNGDIGRLRVLYLISQMIDSMDSSNAAALCNTVYSNYGVQYDSESGLVTFQDWKEIAYDVQNREILDNGEREPITREEKQEQYGKAIEEDIQNLFNIDGGDQVIIDIFETDSPDINEFDDQQWTDIKKRIADAALFGKNPPEVNNILDSLYDNIKNYLSC